MICRRHYHSYMNNGNMEQENGKIRDTIPEIIAFKTADRMTYGALGYDGNELMAFISGYDLEIKFNLRLINSLADAEACADALAQVFYEALMEQLINEKADFVKPPGDKPATLSEKEDRTDVRQGNEHSG